MGQRRRLNDLKVELEHLEWRVALNERNHEALVDRLTTIEEEKERLWEHLRDASKGFTDARARISTLESLYRKTAGRLEALETDVERIGAYHTADIKGFSARLDALEVEDKKNFALLMGRISDLNGQLDANREWVRRGLDALEAESRRSGDEKGHLWRELNRMKPRLSALEHPERLVTGKDVDFSPVTKEVPVDGFVVVGRLPARLSIGFPGLTPCEECGIIHTAGVSCERAKALQRHLALVKVTASDACREESLNGKFQRLCRHRHQHVIGIWGGGVHFECPDCHHRLWVLFAELTTAQRIRALQQDYEVPAKEPSPTDTTVVRKAEPLRDWHTLNIGGLTVGPTSNGAAIITKHPGAYLTDAEAKRVRDWFCDAYGLPEGK